MPLFSFLLLTLCHFLSGFGVLTIFRIRLQSALTITLSLILGIGVASFIPFLLQLFYIVLTGPTIFGSLLLAALLLNITSLIRIRKEGFSTFRRSFTFGRFRVRPYELPFLLILAFMAFVSIWRCYYLPPFSRDALSGPEAIAEYAVREQTMLNSFFLVDLSSTNNPFKSPYLISLQMIYKMAGFPFGQIWLSSLFVSWTVFLYHILRQRVHPVIAGLLLLLLTMVPELYAYTFMILYDYSNMIFFFLGCYFLFDYFNSGEIRRLYFAGLLMGMATYIRSETLLLVPIFIPPILLMQHRAKYPMKKRALTILLFFLPTLAGFYLPVQLYNKHYLPVRYDAAGQINNHLTDLQPLFHRLGDIISRLVTSDLGIHLWGYIFYITALLFLAESIFLRRFTREARNYLYAIGMLWLGLGFLGWLLPLMDLTDSTKRAMFKLFPLLVLYLASNQWVGRLSARISRWETAGAVTRPTASTAITGPGKSRKATVAGASTVSGPALSRGGSQKHSGKKTRR